MNKETLTVVGASSKRKMLAVRNLWTQYFLPPDLNTKHQGFAYPILNFTRGMNRLHWRRSPIYGYPPVTEPVTSASFNFQVSIENRPFPLVI
jgi:hypothetical protein